jgi:hypothetical protein
MVEMLKVTKLAGTSREWVEIKQLSMCTLKNLNKWGVD